MKKCLISILALLISFGIRAEITTYKCNSSPTAMLEDISNKLIKEYKLKEKSLKGNDQIKEYAKKATQEAVMPSLDAEYMAKQIVGRYNWNSATQSEKVDFIKAYQKALASEYSKFLLKTSKKENYLKFYPSRKNTPFSYIDLACSSSKRSCCSVCRCCNCCSRCR